MSSAFRPDHVEKFRDLLREIETVLPLDLINIDDVILSGKWPPRNKGNGCLAVSVTIRNQCAPFQPMVIASSPPNHVARKTGVLEFKIMDTSHSSMRETQYFPISISVFPSGRRVLKIYGLELHSNARPGHYETGTLRSDQRFFMRKPLIYQLVHHLIDSFPLAEGDTKSRDLQSQALTDLDQGGSFGKTSEPSQN